MAFFSKADAKVRLIFELPKLFRSFFSKSFFWSGKVQNLIFVQYFNSSAFLSRKRVQKYCFTAYTPNIRNTFLQIFCSCSRKPLILKRCRTADFKGLWFRPMECLTLLFIRAHVYTGDFQKQPAFHTLGRQVADPQLITVYDIRDISCTSYTQKKMTVFLKNMTAFLKKATAFKKNAVVFKTQCRV